MMDRKRLDEIMELLWDRDPRGFRAECRELGEACNRMLRDRDELTGINKTNRDHADKIAEICERVGKDNKSPLHEAAAEMIRKLSADNDRLRDVAADAVDPARLVKRSE